MRYFNTLAAEFLCAFAWPVSMVGYHYAFKDHEGLATMAWITGFFSYYLTCCLLEHLVTRDDNGKDSIPPVISGGLIIHDLVLSHVMADDTVGSLTARHPKRDPVPVLVLRLLLQFAGATLAYGMARSMFPNMENGLLPIWKEMGKNRDFLFVLGMQILIPSVYGAFALRNANIPYTPVKNELFKYARTGQWLTLLVYPWGGPSFSLVGYLWAQVAYGLPSFGVLFIFIVSSVIQAVFIRILYEVSF